MMVTITSMKKIQHPDLLLDQPSHLLPVNIYDDLKSKSRGRRFNRSNKNRRHHPSEESTSSVSTTTTLTSISTSGFDERIPVNGGDSDREVVIEGLDENTRWSQQGNEKVTRYNDQQVASSSSSCRTLIRTKGTPVSSSTSSTFGWKLPCCCFTISNRQLLVLLIPTLILVASIASILVVVISRRNNSHSSTSVNIDNYEGSNNLFSSSDISQIDGEEETEMDRYDYEDSLENQEDTDKSLDLKEVSRLSWNMLNNNQERISGSSSNNNNNNKESSSSTKGRHHHTLSSQPIPSSFSSISGGQEIVLPSKMIFTSSDGGELNESKASSSSGESKSKKRSCCRTQKYAQVIKRDGCEPLTITNKMCFGQCVSVWVPGLFASFPVCKPSRSSWKTVTLTCGKNKDRKRRVRIEKVRRCSCMEIDPTAASPTSKR